jgi:hypothetical protein
MTINALYVYAPTTFLLSTDVESLAGRRISAGTVELPKGIYRLTGTATPVAPSSLSSEYEAITLGGTKNPFPDPPLRALNELGVTREEIETFFAGSGQRQKLA